MYRIDTTRETPPDWLTVEEYEALSTDPEAEQVGEAVCGELNMRGTTKRKQRGELSGTCGRPLDAP